MFGHFARDLLGKGSPLAGHSDKDRRLHMPDYIQQCDLSVRLPPTLHFLFCTRKGSLLGPQIFSVLRNWTGAVDTIKALARGRFGNAFILHVLTSPP